MALPNISRPIIEPVNNYPDAASRATQKAVCFAVPFLAGLSLKTPQTAAFAVPLLIYGALTCGGDGPPEGTVPNRPAAGGQCQGVAYRVFLKFEYYTDSTGNNTSTTDTNFTVVGPISVTAIPPIGLTLSPANPAWEFNGVQRAFAFLGMVPETIVVYYVRLDGLPDNCGDGPPVLPNPPPDPGPGPYPPIVYPPEGGPVYVEVEIDESQTFFVPIYVGPILFKPEFIFPITINIDGVNFDINPDFVPEVSGGGGGLTPEQEEQLSEAFNASDRIKLDAIADEIFEEQTIQLTGGLCDDEPTSIVVTGNAFDVLAAAFTQESNLRYTQSNGLCPPPTPEPVDESLIFAVTATESGLEFVSGPISPEVVRIRVQITAFNGIYVPPTSYFARANQRKFGSVALSYDDSSAGGEFLWLWDERTYWTLPRRGTSANIRLLISQSVSVSVFDTGDRISLYGG